MKLTVIRGIPGSGKSTYAHKNFDCCVLENDQMQIINGEYEWSSERTSNAIRLVYSIAEQILSSGADVCVCNTFIRKKFIDGYRRLAEKYGADFEVIRLNGHFGNIHGVPAHVLKNMTEHFENYAGELVIDPS